MFYFVGSWHFFSLVRWSIGPFAQRQRVENEHSFVIVVSFRDILVYNSTIRNNSNDLNTIGHTQNVEWATSDWSLQKVAIRYAIRNDRHWCIPCRWHPLCSSIDFIALPGAFCVSHFDEISLRRRICSSSNSLACHFSSLCKHVPLSTWLECLSLNRYCFSSLSPRWIWNCTQTHNTSFTQSPFWWFFSLKVFAKLFPVVVERLLVSCSEETNDFNACRWTTKDFESTFLMFRLGDSQRLCWRFERSILVWLMLLGSHLRRWGSFPLPSLATHQLIDDE